MYDCYLLAREMQEDFAIYGVPGSGVRFALAGMYCTAILLYTALLCIGLLYLLCIMTIDIFLSEILFLHNHHICVMFHTISCHCCSRSRDATGPAWYWHCFGTDGNRIDFFGFRTRSGIMFDLFPICSICSSSHMYYI